MQIILKKKVYTDTEKTFNVDEGSVYIENYNETLDSATVRISHITTPLNIEPFDKVILHDEENRLNDKYMCVDTYTETMESLDPVTYSYEISLFSETKELEGILCPNLSITKLADGTHRSIWHYLEQYLNLYDEKIRSSETVLETYKSKIFTAMPILTTSVTLDFVLGSRTAIEFHCNMISGELANVSIDYQSDRTVLSFNVTSLIAKFTVSIEYFDSKAFINKHFYTASVESYFTSIECPEMQWNTPTLREVITDLMMVADCIPVVRNNSISFIDLTKKKDNISNNTNINYIQRSQSAEDYVSELKMDIVNGMSVIDDDSIKTTVVTTPWMTFRAENGGYIIDDTNVCLFTKFPILKVKHLWMYYSYGQHNESASGSARDFFKLYKVDLCNFDTGSQIVNFLYEKSEYDVLPIERWADTTDNLDEQMTQNRAIYYQRGGNVISGFTSTTKRGYTFGAKTNTVNWIKYLIAKCFNVTNNVATQPTSELSLYYSTYFQIEYETLADCVFTASKDLPMSHNRVIVDNQTNSYVNVYTQGFLEYQKANRLGNKQLMINARYQNNYSNIIKIGDYYNDTIVYQTQYKIYKHHIDVNAVATKDYILRDYFTGVKARIRSWVIASGSEALTRHELDKYYIEFDLQQRNEYIDLSYNMATDFLLPIYHYTVATTASNFNYCNLFITTSDNYYPGTVYNSTNTKLYSTEVVSRIIGNSLVFTFGADDNFEFGKKNKDNLTTNDITSDSSSHQPTYVVKGYLDDYGGFPLTPVRYVDNNGECVSIQWAFMNDLTTYVYDYSTDFGYTFIRDVFDRPLITPSNIVNEGFANKKYYYKDNREILKISTQFEVCSRTHNVVFTKKFLELQKYIRTEDYPVHRYRLFYKNTTAYNFKDTEVPIDAQEVSLSVSNQINVATYNNASADIRLPSVANDLTNITYYITDSDKNTILMVRGTRIFYLNVLKSRDINIYDDDREPVGTI